jgi:hypothetical protein
MSQDGPATRRLRIAAAGDIHCSEQHRDEALSAIASIAGRADLLLLAGDLTTHGEPEQAEVLAQACTDLGIPVLAVLGNHDWHADRRDELVSVLETAGIRVLDRSWAIHRIGGVEVGEERPDARRLARDRGSRRGVVQQRDPHRAQRDLAQTVLECLDLERGLPVDGPEQRLAEVRQVRRGPARCRQPVTPMPARSRAGSGRCRSTTSRYR